MTITFSKKVRGVGLQPEYPPRGAVISWILFDWATQPYYTLITTFVFAPYFATHVVANPAANRCGALPPRQRAS